jgi:hypothetical protein
LHLVIAGDLAGLSLDPSNLITLVRGVRVRAVNDHSGGRIDEAPEQS